MPAKQGTTFQHIMQDLKSRRFAPVYMLMGDEAYYIDLISDYIADHVLSPEERDFNQTICFGSDVTAVQVADMARRYPMMAEYQVIIVKEAQNVRSLEALEKYLKNPVKSTILVWCHKNGKIDARKKTIGLAQAVGVVFESKKLRDYQLPDFIQDYLKKKNVSIDQIVKYFDSNPKAGSLYSFLPLLFSYFQNLMIVHYAPRRNSEQDIAGALDLRNTWGVRDYMIGLKNYSARKTMDIISKLRDIDGKSKGLDNPNTGVGDLMKELVFFILH